MKSLERPSRLDRIIAVLVALVLCAALAIIARPLRAVFDGPLDEDGYYVLAIARRIALGQGVTYEGASLSNGFQPLWVFLCVPLFWLTEGERVSGVRYVLGLHWLLYALGALMASTLFARIIEKISGRRRTAGFIAALVFLSSPFIWSNSFNGLETSLSTVCLLGSILCYISIDHKKRRHLLGCGILLGFLVLARIDSVFFVILLTAAQFARSDGWRTRILNALCLAGPAVLASSPWWLFNLIAFGHLTPSSGLALQDWAPTPSRYMSSVGAVIRAITPPFDWLLNGNTWPRAIARAPIIAVAIYGTLPELRALFRTLDRSTADVLLALALFIVTLAVWYPSSSWATFFYTRYYAPASIVGVLFWSLAILKIVERVHRRIAAAALALLAAQIPALVFLHYSGNADNVLLEKQVPLVEAHVPMNDWVAAVQSGTLGFLRDRVVNLDGRVDFAALGRRHDLDGYLRERGIRWIADWPWLIRQYMGPDFEKLGWTPVAANQSITLYRFDAATVDQGTIQK